MSWLGNFFTGNNTTTTDTTDGTFAGVDQTTPSTLPYTTPTTHIVGTTINAGGYVSGPIGVATGSGSGSYYPSGMGVYNPNQTTTISTGYSTFPNTGTIHIAGTNPTIATDKVKIDLNELGELITVLKERFLILTPNFEKHEKYAALKKAYDNYKLLEAMLSGEDNDNK